MAYTILRFKKDKGGAVAGCERHNERKKEAYKSNHSLIKNRTEKELILWEYYLIYAVVLNVNVKIKDEIIEKYVSEI